MVCLSRMKISTATFLVAITGASIAHAAGPAPELLLKTLAARAGANATDCGVVPLSGDRAAAVDCARKATASGRAYRLALQMKGSDTYTWQGAARDDSGRMWVVFYDEDPSTGPGASPGLGQMHCKDIRYTPDKEEVIDCEPSTGEP